MTPELALRRIAGESGRPVLVLGPSLGTGVEDLWRPVIELLADDFDVFGWDLPGHGSAPPPHVGFSVADLASSLATAVTDLGSAPVHLAGDSLGGAVSMQVTLDHPQLVATVTACCTGAKIDDAQSWHDRIDAVRAGGTAAVVDGSAGRWFAPGFADRRPDVVQPLLDALRGVDDDGYAAACAALADFDIRPRLAHLRAPLLAVAGAQDAVTPTAGLRAVADCVADGRLVVLDDVAHLAPAEAPEHLALLITAHALRQRGDRDVHDAGMAVRREVLGDAHVDRAMAATTDFTRDFQDFITRYAWGTVWTRPGLDRRERSLITLTSLLALGHHEEFAMHVRAALRNGLTPDQIAEALLHASIYCGVPAANSAFRIAAQVLADEGIDLDADGPQR